MALKKKLNGHLVWYVRSKLLNLINALEFDACCAKSRHIAKETMMNIEEAWMVSTSFHQASQAMEADGRYLNSTRHICRV